MFAQYNIKACQPFSLFPSSSQHPSWEIILPEVFRSRYMSGSLPQFDLVFSYSSVEHSGLGITLLGFFFSDSRGNWANNIMTGR